MSKATVAQFFHSIRSLNGILESAISQIQSAWPKVSAAPRTTSSDSPNGDSRNVRANWRPRRATELTPPTPAVDHAAAWLTGRAASNANIVAIDAVGHNGLALFAERFPERCFQIPPGEPHALAWCADLARAGNRLFIFAGAVTAEQELIRLINELGQAECPLTLLLSSPTPSPGTPGEGWCEGLLRGSKAPHPNPLPGAPGRGGMPETLAALRRLPKVAVMSPADLPELEAMLDFSLEADRTAVIVTADDLAAGEPGHATASVLPCRAEATAYGKQLALVSCGPLSVVARRAARVLADEGIECSVLNLRYLQPLDAEAVVETAANVRAAIVLEDELTPGLAGELLELLSRRDVMRPLIVWKPPERHDRSDTNGRHDLYLQNLLQSCRSLARQWPARTRQRGHVPVPQLAALTKLRRASAGRVGCVQVVEQQLSPTIERWAAAYQGFGPRDLYLWKWGAAGATMTMLPCVSPQHHAHSCDTKVLSIMFNALLDDVADCREQSGLLPVLMNVMHDGQPPTGGLSAGDRRYVEFTAELWSEYWCRLRTYPCFDAYEELLRYDLTQLFNSIQYSSLLNRHLGLLNCVEHDLYSPHNMMMMTFATVDLMCSPGFNATELGKLREAMWHAQWMGRIGNLVTTWQREIAAGDFTSGVFARAVASGDLTIDQLQAGDRQEIESAIERGHHQDYYCGRWEHHRRCYLRRAAEVRSVDLYGLLAGHDRLLETYLESRGFL